MLVSEAQMQTAVEALSKLIDDNTLGSIKIGHHDNQTEPHIYIDRTEYELVLIPFVTKPMKYGTPAVLIPVEAIECAGGNYLAYETVFVMIDDEGNPVCMIPVTRAFLSDYVNDIYDCASVAGFKKNGTKGKTKCVCIQLSNNGVRRVHELAEMTIDSVRCPKCGGHMVLRTAKKGYMKGNQFWGCDNFPDCRHTENMRLPDMAEQTGISVSRAQDAEFSGD